MECSAYASTCYASSLLIVIQPHTTCCPQLVSYKDALDTASDYTCILVLRTPHKYNVCEREGRGQERRNEGEKEKSISVEVCRDDVGLRERKQSHTRSLAAHPLQLFEES